MDPIEISQALEATELALLGAAITSPQHLSKISATLRDTDFRKGWPRCLIEAIHSEVEEHGAIEKLSLARRIESNHQNKAAVETVERAIAAASNDQDIDGHIRLVLEAGVNRRVSDLARKLAKDPSLAEVISREIHEEKARLFVKKKDSHINAVMEQILTRIQEQHDHKARITGLETRWAEVNEVTKGLQKKKLIIVAGRPGMGKSMFAQNIAEDSALAGKPVLIISLEMGRDEYVERMLASQSNLEMDKIICPADMTDENFESLSIGMEKLLNSPLHIEDGGEFTMVSAIRNRAEQIKNSHGEIGLIVVDYIQLMASSSNGENRNQEITEISRGLKRLAMDLDVPVIALSQLSRKVEERTDKRPMMSDLRESGAIEQDADVIMFLYRDEYYTKEASQFKGVAEILFEKVRRGKSGSKVTLAFRGEYQRFENLAHEYNSSSSALPRPNLMAGKKVWGGK